MSIWTASASSLTSKGSEVKTPQPRNEALSKPATPAAKRASAAGPPSLYLRRRRRSAGERNGGGGDWVAAAHVSLDSGASAM